MIQGDFHYFSHITILEIRYEDITLFSKETRCSVE